ncbi:DEAD/DEAH box helicase, partial [Streptomyces rubrogriseus]|nr:DEAD/DEAH box helicase [Streptomyces rubrogriseus]
ADGTLRAHALARTLLDRHGVVTRGAVAAEGVEGGFSAVYRILAAFEESGQARRGYVVEGLGAAQFAMEGAVDRLRAVANARERGDGPAGPEDFPRDGSANRRGTVGSANGSGPEGSAPRPGTDGPAGLHDSPGPADDSSLDPFAPFAPQAPFGDIGTGRPSDDVFADPDGLGRSPSRGDYISPRDYAEPGAGGPRGGGG